MFGRVRLSRSTPISAKRDVTNGNVPLVTEEDYEQTDCSQAGSLQAWHVNRLDGTPDAVVPLGKVGRSDLGAFRSTGYYRGGPQLISGVGVGGVALGSTAGPLGALTPRRR